MAVEVSQGTCDLCGLASDATLQECNWLTCTFQHCEGGLYHQECLEKYLKSNKLEKNRKTGFKCPRGCGKGTRFDTGCPGRIDKSHPIHPRNEDKKKTKLAAVVVEPRPAKPIVPVVQNGKATKAKEEGKAEAGKDLKSAAPVKAAPAAKAVTPAAAALALPGFGLKAAKKEATALPPRPEVVAKQKLAELAAQARREIGLPAANIAAMPTHGSKGDLQLLAAAAAGPSKPAGTAAASAWGKPSAPAPEPPAVTPQPAMMSQLPQLQQLLQQAVGKKPVAKAAAPSAPTPVPPASRLAPAVPQPVLNPPTPMWPALGTAQPSTSALFAASAPPVQAPREPAARPASPASAWGSSAAASIVPHQPVPQQPTQQAGTSVASASQPTAPRSQAGGLASGVKADAGAAGPATTAAAASSSGAASAGPSAASAPAASSASPTSAGTGALVLQAASAGAAATSAAGAAAASAPAAVSALAAGAGAGSGVGSGAVAGSLEACSSGHVGASEASAVASAAGTASSRAAGGQLVGADFIDDEVKDQKLTKAQKKNLKRTEKKKGPSALEQLQGCGDLGQEAPETLSRGSLDGGAITPQHGAASTAAGLRQGDAATTSVSGSLGGDGSGVHKRHASRGSDDPEQSHIAEAEEAAVMEELCINCIVARKVLALITQLQRLGAMDFVAAAAIQRHGSNLLGALEWLLVAGADAAGAQPEAVLVAAAESASAAESEVDISEELQQLSDLQAAMGVPSELLQQCVLDCNGDVQNAANTAMERMLAAPAGSAPAVGGSGGDGRAGSSSGGMLASGHGNGVLLPGSASYYSISSLEGAATGPDTDAALQHRLQHQQHNNSHFGVRLQEEPACSTSSYAGGGSCATAFIQGGVVLGAAGWQNGYVRDSPPPGPSAGAGGGRSTSRLMHWLRDESGRAATLEGQPSPRHAGAPGNPLNGLLCAADPPLESPFAAHVDVARGLAGPKAASESPSLHTWLGSNGYHPHHHHHHHHHQVIGGAGHSAAAASIAEGLEAGQELYCGSSNGAFSFTAALSKPTSSMAAQSGALETLAGYGDRWGGLAASGAQRQDASTMLIYASAAAPPEAELAPHNEGENDLSSIMALINVR